MTGAQGHGINELNWPILGIAHRLRGMIPVYLSIKTRKADGVLQNVRPHMM